MWPVITSSVPYKTLCNLVSKVELVNTKTLHDDCEQNLTQQIELNINEPLMIGLNSLSFIHQENIQFSI